MKSTIAAVSALLAVTAPAYAAGKNWLGTTAVTQGGHRMGNPAAKTKLMEFVSYTCPHCGHFFKEADGAIKLTLIRPGKASVEIRHLIRDPVDYAAVVLSECGDPKRFFARHDMFFAEQDTWLGKLRDTTRAQQERWYAGTISQRLRAVAGDAGFYDMMETQGVSRVQADTCFNDAKKVQALFDQSKAAADKYGVNSTPSFVVNGKTVDAHSWAELKPLLAS
jgi:protein-disulfide isomerase